MEKFSIMKDTNIYRSINGELKRFTVGQAPTGTISIR